MRISVATFAALLLSPALAADEINPNFVHDLKRNLERYLSIDDKGSLDFSSLPRPTIDGIASRRISAKDDDCDCPNDRLDCMQSLATMFLGMENPDGIDNPYSEGGLLQDHQPFTILDNVTDEAWADVCTPSDDYSVMNCDVSSFFKGRKISKICRQDVEGEFKTMVMTSCSEMPMVVHNIPFCLFSPCTPEDFSFLYSDALFYNQTAECNEILRFTGYAGFECLAESMELYGFDSDGNVTAPTNLTDLFIGNTLSPEFLTNKTFCDEDIDLVNETINYHCDADRYYNGDVKPICENMGGSYMEVDVSFAYYYEDLGIDFYISVVIENMPFCNAAKCQGNEALSFWDLLMEFELENVIDSKLSTIDYCFEQPNSMVYLKTKNKGGAKEVRCTKLRKDYDARETACSQDLAPSGVELAAEACPATCGRCNEDPGNMFVWKKKNGVLVYKTCAWLETRGSKMIEKLCRRNRMTDEITTASGACPDTCGLNYVCVADDYGDLYPVCPGRDEGDYCDGGGDCEDTDFCECDAGKSFCATKVNPCGTPEDNYFS